MRRLALIFLATALGGGLAAGAASAQDTEGLGTIVKPLEPEKKVGLPDQEPDKPAAPVVPPAAKRVSQNAAQQGSGQSGTQGFGDWTLECVTGGEAKCQATTRSNSGDQKQVILVLSVASSGTPKQTRYQMALPLGFSIPPGVEVKVGAYSRVLPVSRCTAQGCLVEGVMPDALAKAMRENAQGSVAVQTGEDGAPITLPLSLKGFGDAFAAMEKRNGGAS